MRSSASHSAASHSAASLAAARHHRVAALVVLFALVYLFAAIGASAAAWQRFAPETGPAASTYARWYVPDSAPLGEPLPAIIFLHGSGATPEVWFPFLTHIAESHGVVLLLPNALSPFGFGVGADDQAVDQFRELLAAEVMLDPARISIAGHSSGGAYAYVLGLAGTQRYAGIFSMSAPFRTVLSTGDDTYTPPVRLYYGEDDPNVQIVEPLTDMLDRLEVGWQLERQPDYGHNTFPLTTLPDAFDFLLAQRYQLGGPCFPTATRLCLRDGRFAAEVTWRDPRDRQGPGMAIPGGDDTTGVFWFFRASNWEMMVKVLDGCTSTDHFWVFASSATTLEYRLTVTDLQSDTEAIYENSLGQAAPAITDTRAFATCP